MAIMYKINLGKLKQVINLIISNKKYVEKDVIRMLRFIAKRRGGGIKTNMKKFKAVKM